MERLPGMDYGLFETLVEQSMVGMYVNGGDRFLYVNEAFARLYGYQREELLELAVLDVVVPEARSMVAEKVERRLRGELEQARFTVEMLRKDGSTFWGEVLGKRVDYQGVPAIFGCVVDVSENRRMEEELRDSKGNFERVVNTISDLVALIDTDFRVKLANSATFNALRIEPREIRGRYCYEIFRNRDTRCENCPAVDAMETGKMVRRFRFSETGTVLDRRVYPVMDEKGEAREILIVASDVTERVRTEEALKRSESLYRSLLNDVIDKSNVGVIILDSDLNIVWINRATEIFFGINKEEVIGKSKRELLRRHIKHIFEDPERFESLVLATYENNTYTENFVCHVVPGYGREERWLEHWSQPIESGPFAGGRIEHYHDITDQRRLEAQLHMSQRLEAIGRLAGGIAHDFNNILMVILGSCELLDEDSSLSRVDPAVRERISMIERAANKAAELTRQLLVFSKKQMMEPRVEDLNFELSELKGMLERVIGEDVELRLSLAPQPCNVRVDPSHVDQVIMNLVMNAREAMPKGGTLHMYTEVVDLSDPKEVDSVGLEPGRYVVLGVRDTGVGMDDETRSRIFEPFFTTKEGGTGLGLATVYGVVSQLGGVVHCESELGRGTTFKIYLPFVDEAEAGDEEAIASEGATGVPTGGILVVEDDETVRSLTVMLLRKMGYRVFEASNGEEALALLGKARAQVDLVLTDVVMPKMGGVELANKMEHLYPTLKVLFMSGYPSDASEDEKSKAVDTSRVIYKPFSKERLASKIREALSC